MLVRKWLGGAGNMMRNDGTGSQRLSCRFENILEGKVSLTALGVLVKNGLEGQAWQS